MFTGLIESTGRILRRDAAGDGCQLHVTAELSRELTPGESIAVNGVCLTVTSHDRESFAADLSPSTLAATSLGALVEGRRVNLERPVRADARMGGHFVLGHVDGTGRLRSIRLEADCYWLDVHVPSAVEVYLIAKGSIAVDGISLTVADLRPGILGLQIVPFTWAHTALADAAVGDAVNLEADVLGKYVHRLLSHRLDPEAARIGPPAALHPPHPVDL